MTVLPCYPNQFQEPDGKISLKSAIFGYFLHFQLKF